MGGIQDNKYGLCLKKKEARRGMREKIMTGGGRGGRLRRGTRRRRSHGILYADCDAWLGL